MLYSVKLSLNDLVENSNLFFLKHKCQKTFLMGSAKKYEAIKCGLSTTRDSAEDKFLKKKFGSKNAKHD